MYKITKDYDFLISCFSRFFKEKNIIEKLNDIENLDISGWEIWLQVELLIFLASLDNIAEVYREERCFMDLQKEKLKTLCSIDFIIRQKGAHSFIPLGIKQNSAAASCIRNMCKDLEKYNKIRDTQLPSERNLWLMGIHRKVSREHIIKLIRKNYLDLDERFIFTQEIKNTNFMFTLF
ncbi:Uncharacterised protein [Actinobacillus ureae]|uniref:Uncharacterized protein n=1 Tax=Actinobacillus ureae ATCC 25976 TaxID=887324 RepID=E8KF64_9PAST|nr:hypothetical protein [Actinobacillus ureae]EFX92491.1 hypothetical protein HMPREF0027_0481 [Actinobacillus ureae ATCC 25976]SUT85464.1 Uncharacterised protein [Actinobacillus ureae]SUU42698.1 Uncharacterised protein [Actinobacillus ureae]